MERSAEQIIREKIKLAEGNAVAWNKERVWSNLVIEKKTPWRRFALAAAVVFVLIVSSVYVSLVGSTGSPTATNSPTATGLYAGGSGSESTAGVSAEDSLVKYSTGSTTKYSTGSTTKRSTGSAKESTSKENSDSIITFTNSGNNLVTETQPVLKTEMLSKAEDSIRVDVHVRKADSKKQKVIAAVVGVIPAPSPVAVRSKKKIKIYLNGSSDQNSVAAAAEEVKLYSAHLN